MDGGAWWAIVHGVAKSRTWLSDFTFTFHFHELEIRIDVYTLLCVPCVKQIASRKLFGEGNGTPLQYSCLENPRDMGAWWAAVYGVAQSWTRLKQLSSSSEYFISVLFLPEVGGGEKQLKQDKSFPMLLLHSCLSLHLFETMFLQSELLD